MGGARSKASKGVVEFRPYVTRVLPVGAQIVCADNTGAKLLEIINHRGSLIFSKRRSLKKVLSLQKRHLKKLIFYMLTLKGGLL